MDIAVYSRESSRKQNKSLLVTAMEAECRDYLAMHNRQPPMRRPVPPHKGLREFLICDASVLIDHAGMPTSDTLDSIICMHPDPHRAAAVTESLHARPLSLVADADAYECASIPTEQTIDELYDGSDDELCESETIDKWDDMLDADVLNMIIPDTNFTVSCTVTSVQSIVEGLDDNVYGT